MTNKKELLQKLLKGIETGDPEAASVVNEDKYIQHNPRTGEGSLGLAELFAQLAKTNPKVTFHRVFEDGDFAFAHNEYDFGGVEVAFEVFRFEDGLAVEHWDNLQPIEPANPSGRNMLDGATKIVDLDKTEANREMIDHFVQKVLVAREYEHLADYVADDLIQHDPETADGMAAFRTQLETNLAYETGHRLLAEGNFVLSICEGHKEGVHCGLYDLFRLEDSVIVERWNTITPIAPREEWKNDNGKF